MGGSVLSTNFPPVDMTHIFCGQISGFRATGFHSLTPTTNWQTCATTQQCQFFDNGNAYCKNVFIYDAHSSHSWELKDSGSTLFPEKLSAAWLVQLLQYLFNTCKPAAQNAALCFDDCYYKGNSKYFDIVIGTNGNTIVTAYPAQQGTCRKHPEWQDCNKKYCQGL